jgi:hypothetical protein
VGQRSSANFPNHRDDRCVSEIDAKLLMNHSIPGVNAGYITRHKLLEDHLRRQQQAISSAVFSALGMSLLVDKSCKVGSDAVLSDPLFRTRCLNLPSEFLLEGPLELECNTLI